MIKYHKVNWANREESSYIQLNTLTQRAIVFSIEDVSGNKNIGPFICHVVDGTGLGFWTPYNKGNQDASSSADMIVAYDDLRTSTEKEFLTAIGVL